MKNNNNNYIHHSNSSSKFSKKEVEKGIVYFGYCPYKNNIKENGSNIDIDIDIKVPPFDEDKDKEKIEQIYSILNTNNINVSHLLENKKYGVYFYIYFNPDYMKYYIKDCGLYYGTFIKIQNEIILKSNYIINIGDTFLIISIGIENKSFLNEEKFKEKKKIFSFSDSEYNNNLNLKILCKGKIIYDPINFQPTKSTIRIGRNSNCEVVVEDHLLSRIHCTIVYRKNIGWIIRDGIYNKNKDGSIEMKPSTNGTWLYALEDMPIYEGMIIKSNNNLFKFSFLK